MPSHGRGIGSQGRLELNGRHGWRVCSSRGRGVVTGALLISQFNDETIHQLHEGADTRNLVGGLDPYCEGGLALLVGEAEARRDQPPEEVLEGRRVLLETLG